MAILIDFSQIALSNVLKSPGIHKGTIDESLICHMILNSLRMYNMKFRHEYGNMIICCDGRNYWRKGIFPHYKANRKKNRDESSIDWKAIFKTINTLRDDLRNIFPYKVIETEGAEADDIIAILCHELKNEQSIIISGDKDYGQLHSLGNIKQYSPTKKDMIVIDDPVKFLRSLIIKGDTEDGIPNIKSDSDTFVDDAKRQGKISKNDIEHWSRYDDPKKFCESITMLNNYTRNKQLIDFSCIPDNIRNAIMIEYDKPIIGNRQKIMDYFISKRMRNLLSVISEF